MTTSVFGAARARFHAELFSGGVLKFDHGVASNADRANKMSRRIAEGIAKRIGAPQQGKRQPGQTAGNKFEGICERFLKDTFLELKHLRPGRWDVRQVVGHNRLEIAEYEQYAHLKVLQTAANTYPELKAALGSDYTVTPDVVITREPETDEVINAPKRIVDPGIAHHSSLRKSHQPLALLHASISCKWTIRSDRAQNSRTEGLNLVKNRKGRLPHVVVVTGEPLPSRLASVALGTGEIDCVYHFALTELQQTVVEGEYEDAEEMLRIMVEGKRLRDIADLPLDLAV